MMERHFRCMLQLGECSTFLASPILYSMSHFKGVLWNIKFIYIFRLSRGDSEFGEVLVCRDSWMVRFLEMLKVLFIQSTGTRLPSQLQPFKYINFGIFKEHFSATGVKCIKISRILSKVMFYLR